MLSIAPPPSKQPLGQVLYLELVEDGADPATLLPTDSILNKLADPEVRAGGERGSRGISELGSSRFGGSTANTRRAIGWRHCSSCARWCFETLAGPSSRSIACRASMCLER